MEDQEERRDDAEAEENSDWVYTLGCYTGNKTGIHKSASSLN